MWLVCLQGALLPSQVGSADRIMVVQWYFCGLLEYGLGLCWAMVFTIGGVAVLSLCGGLYSAAWAVVISGGVCDHPAVLYTHWV